MAILEMALIVPWFCFLFFGSLDWGFLASALISMQSATRTAALFTSAGVSTASDSATACALVLGEMRKLPNIGMAVTTCSGSPLTVTAASVIGPDLAAASQVTVIYTPVAMIPIPGLLPSRFTLTRTVKMRLRS
jgi:Flp pilus assembly protein TadG